MMELWTWLLPPLPQSANFSPWTPAMIPLPYVLLDRVCSLAASLDGEAVEALAELLRRQAKSGHYADLAGLKGLAPLVVPPAALGGLHILCDTWTMTAPATSGAEVAAALAGAWVALGGRDLPQYLVCEKDG